MPLSQFSRNGAFSAFLLAGVIIGTAHHHVLIELSRHMHTYCSYIYIYIEQQQQVRGYGFSQVFDQTLSFSRLTEDEWCGSTSTTDSPLTVHCPNTKLLHLVHANYFYWVLHSHMIHIKDNKKLYTVSMGGHVVCMVGSFKLTEATPLQRGSCLQC
eukprot:gb/GECG01006622.1/.p1 GENE.gb/GECG01006622.1/~~gb/GECG01006622.1/.p1  ORF type:complete len:156 (+),score=5.02 gb/GECG01006622.1/:1-468(+)